MRFGQKPPDAALSRGFLNGKVIVSYQPSGQREGLIERAKSMIRNDKNNCPLRRLCQYSADCFVQSFIDFMDKRSEFIPETTVGRMVAVYARPILVLGQI